MAMSETRALGIDRDDLRQFVENAAGEVVDSFRINRAGSIPKGRPSRDVSETKGAP